MGFQHLFQRRSTKAKRENPDLTETFKTLIDSRIDRLESNFNLLRGEWADCYEKIMLLYDRNRKRLKAIEKASGEEIDTEPAPTPITSREELLRAFDARNGA